MDKLTRTVDRTLGVLPESVVLHAGENEAVDTYLTTQENQGNAEKFNEDSTLDKPDVIVFSSDGLDLDAIKYMDDATVVIVEEDQSGSLRRRNTSEIHVRAFGEFAYLDDEGPHVIVYSEDPMVIREVSKPIELDPVELPEELDIDTGELEAEESQWDETYIMGESTDFPTGTTATTLPPEDDDEPDNLESYGGLRY